MKLSVQIISFTRVMRVIDLADADGTAQDSRLWRVDLYVSRNAA